MVDSIPELFDLLGRDPRGLIGQPETVWLEFKAAPYGLDREHQKFELAKDVSAMANANGGVILIGIRTRHDERRREDVAEALRPLPRGRVDPQQVRDIISEWVFPRLDVDVNPHPLPDDERGRELWSIFIQRGRESDQPFIVARQFVGQGGSDKNLFAVFERSGSHNRPYESKHVHGWINRGRWSLSEPEAEVVPPMEEAAEVLVEDYSALGLPDQATSVYMQAAPAGSTRLARFYRGGVDGSLYERLIRPQHNLRSRGFNLPDVGQPERTQRGALRVVWAEEDSISVTPAGLATAIQGQRHLTWAGEKFVEKKGEEAWINPLALVEFTLDFWRFFVGEVLSRSESTRFTWRAGMKGLIEGPVRLYLPERFDHFAQKQEATGDSFNLDWVPSEEGDPDRLAYAVLSEVYAQFGFDAAVIPHTEGERISHEAILNIR